MSSLFDRGKRGKGLEQQILDLGPWHHDVQVTPDLSTAVSLESHGAGVASFSDVYRPRFEGLVSALFPSGSLRGKTFLDCACNSGGYCFWAREMEADQCVGFDVRQHWIDQAEFLQRNRTFPSDRIRFFRSDLYEVPALKLPQFDITLFKGIFYHLPDPITGLRIAADLTSELLLFDSEAHFGHDDGFLAVANENTENLMSGVHGLNWFPTGPEVVKRILLWMGFSEFRVLQNERNPNVPNRGRIGLMAARSSGYFADFDVARDRDRARL